MSPRANPGAALAEKKVVTNNPARINTARAISALTPSWPVGTALKLSGELP